MFFVILFWGTLLVTPRAAAVAGGGESIDTILLRITFTVLLCDKNFMDCYKDKLQSESIDLTDKQVIICYIIF